MALTQPVADFIVAVGRDGRVLALGKDISALAAEDKKFAKELKREQEQVKQALEQEGEGSSSATVEGAAEPLAGSGPSKGTSKKDGKLVVAEEIAMGRVGWKTLKLYLFNMSQFPLVFLFCWMALITLTQGLTVFATYFLGKWGDEYDHKNPEDVAVGW